MEQHPVPQDVTGFEFKLIGDMTIKQFIFLAAGVVLAYLSFRTTFIPVLLRIPASLLFGLGGVLFAFFPIEERPLDRWVSAFFTRIYQPTQYVWKKNMAPPDILTQLSYKTPRLAPAPQQLRPKTQTKEQKMNQYLATLPKKEKLVKTRHEQKEHQILQQVASLFEGHAMQKSHPTPSQSQKLPTSQVPINSYQAPQGKHANFLQSKQVKSQTQQKPTDIVKDSVLIEEKTKKLNDRITNLQKELGTQTITRERFLELQKELSSLLQEKEGFLQRLVDLRKQLEEQNAVKAVRPTEFAQDTEIKKTTVKILPQQLAKKKGLPQLTSFPNVVTGIVKTAKGELLPNILITVKDKEEMPVRALKTNKLGQFAASAPLANATYRIEVEDPQKRYKFDLVEITLSGAMLPPLEIFAKSEREINRQKLHKEIFGTQEI